MSRQINSWIWRFNAYVIAAAGLIAIALGTFALYQVSKNLLRQRHVGALATAPKTSTSPANQAAQSKPNFTIGRFGRIAGTPILRAAISSSEDRRRRYYSKTATATRNFIFYHMTSGRQHYLLPNNNAIIENQYDLRLPLPSGGINTAAAPIALLYQLIDKDTNGDGLLSPRDRKTLALAQPDGSGLIRPNVSYNQMLGHAVISSKELVVLARQQDGVNAIHISLENFKVLRQMKITQ